MRSLDPRIVAAALALAVMSCAPEIDYSGPTSEWNQYGGDLGGLRYSALSQITADNVGHLEKAWEYRSGDLSDGTGETTHSSLQVTPIVADGVMYFCTPFNRVIALDPETGEELWAFDPDLQLTKLHGAYPLTCRGVSTWLDEARGPQEQCRRRIFTGTHDSELIALDAKTGTPCADFGDNGRVALRDTLEDTPDWEYYVTSPPLPINGLVVVGALVADNVRVNAPAGVVRAFDARTGELRWAWDPVPPTGAPDTADTSPGPPYRRATANVWSVMSGDAERNLVFVPTGNAPPDYWGAERDSLDYYSSSVVALRASGPQGGELVWHFQTVHHDLWDYDIGAQPTLFDLPSDNGDIPAVAVSTKMGHVFFLHRETGEPLFPVEERAVPQGAEPGETLSPTQPFPTRPPTLYPSDLTPDSAWGVTFWDRGKCRDLIAGMRSDGIFTPPSVQGSVHYPGALGGVNWGGASIDPQRGIYVANQSRVPTTARLIPRDEYEPPPEDQGSGGVPGAVLYGPMEGTPYVVERELLLSPLGLPCSKPPWGTLTAVDVATGTVRWEVPLGTTRGQAPWPFWLKLGMPNLGGPVITAGGVVFIAATPDNYLRAFDLESGDELWKGRLPYGGMATPLTYRLDENGKQYVVIAAGGHGFTEPGDAIVAFALPGSR